MTPLNYEEMERIAREAAGWATHPWSYQEKSDAYTHIVRGPVHRFICQLPQSTSGRAEDIARHIAAFHPDAVLSLLEERKVLREALERARIWHEAEAKALSKQPPGGDRDWRRMQHGDELLAIDAALSSLTAVEGEKSWDDNNFASQSHPSGTRPTDYVIPEAVRSGDGTP